VFALPVYVATVVGSLPGPFLPWWFRVKHLIDVSSLLSVSHLNWAKLKVCGLYGGIGTICAGELKGLLLLGFDKALLL